MKQESDTFGKYSNLISLKTSLPTLIVKHVLAVSTVYVETFVTRYELTQWVNDRVSGISHSYLHYSQTRYNKINKLNSVDHVLIIWNCSNKVYAVDILKLTVCSV